MWHLRIKLILMLINLTKVTDMAPLVTISRDILPFVQIVPSNPLTLLFKRIKLIKGNIWWVLKTL